MAEHYSMYDPALRGAVLQLVARWKRLPLSDLLTMLRPEDQLRYRDDVLEDLAWQGHIQHHFRGDERVIEITPAGEQWVQQHGRSPGPTPTSGESR